MSCSSGVQEQRSFIKVRSLGPRYFGSKCLPWLKIWNLPSPLFLAF
ncbi:hypothetical protein ZOSMA_61G00170 [Zostera marina]|uniref:Uncharacterized protein n=1 Tax=Zostera marina TaxID=29655 RepID=A0A0K9NTC2_ZOSMR|nr:hypothetical protein ZOSMA_61G00170 [Zostera marina]